MVGETGLPAVSEAIISAELLQELIDWAREAVPNEACGILAADRPAGEGGRPTRFHPMRNAAESPLRYHMDPHEQLAVMTALDDGGQVVWGIFHSHVRSPAEPSPTDRALAFYPDSLYIICSLQGEIPEVRAWTFAEDEPREVPLGVGKG